MPLDRIKPVLNKQKVDTYGVPVLHLTIVPLFYQPVQTPMSILGMLDFYGIVTNT